MNMPTIDMSSIISILMAIALAFTSMGGMTADLEGTVSFDANIALDMEAVMALSGLPDAAAQPDAAPQVTEEQKETFQAVGELISAMTLRGTAGKDAAEAVLLAGDSVALSVGMKKDDAGVTVATSLLPADVIFISEEMLRRMQEEMEQQNLQVQGLQLPEQTAAEGDGQAAAVQSTVTSLNPQDIAQILEKLDKEQIAKDIEEAYEKLSEGIEAKKGETETGEFNVDDMTFVSRTPVNMTYPEFAEFMLTGMKDLAARESLKPLMDAAGKDIGAEIDKAIEELKNQPEADYPEVFDLAVYADADNCTYSVSDMVRQSEAGKEELHIAYGDIEGQSRMKIIRNQGDDRMTVIATGDKESTFDLTANIESKTSHGEIKAGMDEQGNLNITCSINDGDQVAKIVFSAEKAEDDRTNFQFEVSFDDTGKPMFSFSGSFGKGGEPVSVFEGEKIKVIPAEKLMDSESTESAALGIKLLAGIMKTVMVVTKNVPEETGEWINAKIKELMSPKPEATEAPQEQVVDGE